jgi:sec-independent protein translocase protein TatB
MEILGIGPSELIFVILIALIILGPRDMQKAGRTIGRWLNQLIHSDGWKAFQRTSHELRTLPNKLMREANNEILEAEKDLRKVTTSQPSPFAKTPAMPQSPSRSQAIDLSRSLPQPPGTENSIQPPPATDQTEGEPEINSGAPDTTNQNA